jgi:hydroxymethylbilane synthase
MKSRIVIGSRGSKLALTQAQWVRSSLVSLAPECEIEIEIVKTSGDVKTEPLAIIGGQGVFTKELEEALLSGAIDLAVHSLKDLPTIVPPGLALSAICEREDPRDALILPSENKSIIVSIADLPKRSVVGTSSPRRVAQLCHLRDDIEIKEVRGNVDTRLRKLDEGEYDALLLAVAGLRRLGLENRVSATITPTEMLPAVGQGALGLETRAGDEATIAIVRKLNHQPTQMACLSERALLRALGGGCQLPIAGYAVTDQQQLILEGLVTSTDGKEIVRDCITGQCSDAELLGATLGKRLLHNGAAKLLPSGKA